MTPTRWPSTPHVVRVIVNTVNLSTPLGLLVAAAGRSRLRAGGRGLVLAEHSRLGPRRAGAFTLGNVVIVPRGELADLQRRTPEVLDHESAHAWQYAVCLGLPFLPLYALASGWSWLRTGDPAAANVFETTAGLLRGGYAPQPKDNSGLRKLTRRRR